MMFDIQLPGKCILFQCMLIHFFTSITLSIQHPCILFYIKHTESHQTFRTMVNRSTAEPTIPTCLMIPNKRHYSFFILIRRSHCLYQLSPTQSRNIHEHNCLLDSFQYLADDILCWFNEAWTPIKTWVFSAWMIIYYGDMIILHYTLHYAWQFRRLWRYVYIGMVIKTNIEIIQHM